MKGWKNPQKSQGEIREALIIGNPEQS